jgi:hypothetical protein
MLSMSWMQFKKLFYAFIISLKITRMDVILCLLSSNKEMNVVFIILFKILYLGKNIVNSIKKVLLVFWVVNWTLNNKIRCVW